VDVVSPADFDQWLREKQAEKKLADVAPNAPAVTASVAPAAVTQ
jgi:heme/copper-type cytochrome/quinol oxidase subunit 2